MLNAFVGGLLARGASLVITQSFANRLMLLCEQAACNPYLKDSINAQIATEIRTAFANAPLQAHEQMASDLLSALASFPVHAAQLRQLGPQECARRYPLLAPVIYSIADVLMPGWNSAPFSAALPNPLLLAPSPLTPSLPTTPRLAPFSTPLQIPSPMRTRAPVPTPAPALDAARIADIFANLRRGGSSPRVEEISDVPEGLEEAARKIEQLQATNPTAYRRGMQKLSEARAHTDGSETSARARDWLGGVVRLPLWNQEQEDGARQPENAQQRADLIRGRQKLDAAVAGHEEAKGRVMDRLALWLRNPNGPGLVLGMQGPPGNGKTSLVSRGLAETMKRKVRIIDMGGIGDASKLRGDRSVYLNSAPGKVAEYLMECGTARIILVLDEVDRVTDRGVQDVLSNLTDPNRNAQFEDNYFEGVPLDLSRTTIVCTFNEASRLDAALKDRMGQIVHTHALTSAQKLDIAKRFLIPEALKDVRREGEVEFSDGAVRYLVGLCSSDKGARGLKSYIQRVVGTVNRTMIEQDQNWSEVSEAQIARLFPGGEREEAGGGAAPPGQRSQMANDWLTLFGGPFEPRRM